MSEITQRLGFDATQAIASLTALNAALKPVNTSLARFNANASQSGAQQVTASLNGLAGAAGAANSALASTSSSFTRAGQAGAQAGKDITVSWETMIRVVQTQILVRALNAGIRGFHDSAEAAAAFQEQIGRLSGIVPGALGNVDALSDSIKDLAVEMGRPAADVAAAAYEAFQNDLGDTAQTMEFVAGATQRLSLVTGGSLTDSVNTLSSVLKSYNLEISEADRVTDLLYQTIDSGRVGVDELSRGIGTIAPLAREAGLSLEDMFAATAAITLGGTNAATAITQLRNVTAKGIRPTKELQAAMEGLGASTFEQLIQQSGGFTNALQRLIESADGNKKAVADMFNTIRAQLGVFGLTADGAQTVTRILDAMERSVGRTARTAEEIDKLDFRQMEKAWARIERVVLDTGETTLKLKTQFFELIADVAERLPTLEQGFATMAALATGALVAIATTAGLAAAAITGPLALAIVAVGALLGGLTGAFTLEAIENWGRGVSEEVQRVRDTRLAAEEAVKTQTSAYLKALDEEYKANAVRREQAYKGLPQLAKTAFNTLVAETLAASQKIIEGEKQSLEAFANSRKAVVEQIKTFIQEVDKRILDSQNRIRAGQRSLEDFNFERSLKKLNDQQIATKRIEAAEKALKEAREAAASAGTDEVKQAQARELQAIADKKAQEALAASDKVGNAYNVRKAEDLVRDSMEQGIETEKKLVTDLQTLKEQNLQKQLTQAEKLFAKEKELIERIIELQTKMSDPSKKVSPIDLENLAEAKTELEGLLNKEGTLNIFDIAGMRAAVTDSATLLTTEINQATFDFINLRNSIQQKISESPFQGVLELSTKDTGNTSVDNTLQAASGGTANPVESLIEQEKALSNTTKLWRENNEKIREQTSLIDSNKAAINEINPPSNIQAYADALEKAGNPALAANFRTIAEGLNATNALNAESSVATLEEAKVSIQAAATAGEALKASGQVQQATLDGLLEQVTAAVKVYNAVDAAQLLGDLVPQEQVDVATKRLGEIRTELDTLKRSGKLTELETSATNAKTSIKSLSTSATNAQTSLSNAAISTGAMATNTSGAKLSVDGINQAGPQMVAFAESFASAMERARVSAVAAAAAASSGGSSGGSAATANAYFGSKVNYRAAGGFSPRGGDTQLTATDPEEYIMSARSSRNFLAELQAMNAGQRPQYREDGGQVTNVGDININVNNSSAKEISGRDLAISLQRELRRNTSRI